jgi:hypothetical protein
MFRDRKVLNSSGEDPVVSRTLGAAGDRILVVVINK